MAKETITYKSEFTVAADVDACWNAWTDAKELDKWLGSSSSVGQKAGEDFCITSTLPYMSGCHKIVDIDKGKKLSFSWYVKGYPTKLELSFEKLKGQNDKTKLTLSHTMVMSPVLESAGAVRGGEHPFSYVRGSFEVVVKRYRSYLEKSSFVEMPKWNGDHQINLYVDIKAKPEVIWTALTDVEIMKKWSPDFRVDGTVVDLKVGGAYTYGWYGKDVPVEKYSDGPSKILKLEKNKLLQLNWHDLTMSEVSWQLEDKGDGITRVTFKHTNLPAYPTPEIWSYRLGWTCDLYCLKKFAETGEICTDWQKEVK